MDTFNKNEGFERHFTGSRSRLVFNTSSPYQNIYVMERNRYEGKKGRFRLLQFSSDAIQGILNLEQPKCLVASYSRITVDLINHYASDFNNGFIIGHGIGTVSTYYSNKNVLTAEIDPLVVEVSRKYFGYTGRNVEVGDGQAILKTQKERSQDMIFLDAYSSSEIPNHLTTKEFFTLTNEKLSDTGILILNYIGRIKDDTQLHKLYASISEIFPCVKVFATNPKIMLNQNIFFIASKRILDDYSPREAAPIEIS